MFNDTIGMILKLTLNWCHTWLFLYTHKCSAKKCGVRPEWKVARWHIITIPLSPSFKTKEMLLSGLIENQYISGVNKITRLDFFKRVQLSLQ